MQPIDKAAVRRSFNRAARYYDENAHLQRAVANRLLAYAGKPPRRPARILDAGAGSGFGTAALAGAFPDSCIVGLDFAQEMLNIARCKPRAAALVCGDAEALPFAPFSFDLVCTSSALQWSGDTKTALLEFQRVLKKDSPLWIAVYTAGTLRELQDSWRGIDDHAHTLEFPTPRQLCRLLKTAGMAVAACRTQNEVVLYDSVDALLKTLKYTGVRNFRRDRGAGLTTPSRLENMKARYRDRYATPHKIPASYTITFLSARTDAAPA